MGTLGRAIYTVGFWIRETGQAIDRLGSRLQGNYYFHEQLSRHRTLMNVFGKAPFVDKSAFVAPSASVIGDVQDGVGSSIWYGCVLRGDVNSISVWSGTNIQDNSLVHVAKSNLSGKVLPTIIGDSVTVGHSLLRSLRRVSTVSSLYNHSLPLKQQPLPGFTQIRQLSYISEMRKSAFEDKILRLLRNEIQYELESSPPSQPVEKYECFKVDERPGEQWIKLSRNFGEKEVITVEVTMFDHSIPAKESGDVTKGEDVQLHLTMIVNISKGEDGDVLEFVCSAWPNSVEIRQVFAGRRQRLPGTPYLGPGFNDLDDELQMELYDFLETRGISDELATFLHEYMKNKDKLEFTRWMEKLKSCIETKGGVFKVDFI